MANEIEKFEVTIKETRLVVQVKRKPNAVPLSELEKIVKSVIYWDRGLLERRIKVNPEFLRSMVSVEVSKKSPNILRKMAAAGEAWGIGPMSAVAGALAQVAGEALLPHADYIVINNGGDVYMRSKEPVISGLVVRIQSPFAGLMSFEIPASPDGIGVCCSAGTLGHSDSLGFADAVVTLHKDAAVADAAATAIANRIRRECDVAGVIDEIEAGQLLDGAIIIIGKTIGFCENIKVFHTSGKEIKR